MNNKHNPTSFRDSNHRISDSLKPLSDDEAYQSYFEHEVWSLDIFSALIAGITPENRNQIDDPLHKGKKNTASQHRQNPDYASKIKKMFLKDFKKEPIDYARILDGKIFMSSWKFIKWVALNRIDLYERFLYALPPVLVEILIEFQPHNVALRTKSKHSTAYHRALYLKAAKEIRFRIPGRPTREELFKHPQLQKLLHSFRKHDGKPKKYAKRTITDNWLRVIDPQRVGRPSKNSAKISF